VFLMDSVCETARMVREHQPRNAAPVLGIYADLAERLVGTPRYLFDNNAIHTAVELTLGRPKVLLEALQHLRIPYPKLWVEWEETGRNKLRQKFIGEIGPNRPLPDRVGFLLDCDASGRKGHTVWAWSAMGDVIPNIAPFAPFFDFDARYTQPHERIDGLLNGNLAKIWDGHPVQQQAMLEIWQTADHRPEGPWAQSHLEEMYRRQGNIAIAYAMSDVYGEYIQMLACLLLLTSSRKIVELAPVDMSRLNRARARQHKVPRLDHTVVSMYLDPAVQARQQRAPLGYARKSPRVHLVSSYLGRRGDKHFVVQPYTRGQGETVHRRVSVRG